MTDAEYPFLQLAGPVEDPYPRLKAVLVCVPCLLLLSSFVLFIAALTMADR